MAFTYDETLSTNLSLVRFHIQDVTSGNGPRPQKANFSDEEITALLSVEGTWQGTVAACFDALSAAWQNNPVFGVGELGTTHGRIAEGYAGKAAKWRSGAAKGNALANIGFLDTLREADYIQNIATIQNG